MTIGGLVIDVEFRLDDRLMVPCGRIGKYRSNRLIAGAVRWVGYKLDLLDRIPGGGDRSPGRRSASTVKRTGAMSMAHERRFRRG